MLKKLLKQSISFISVSCAILLLGGIFADKVSPVVCWPLAFLGILLPYLYILNMVVLLAAISSKSWSALVSISILVFGWSDIQQHIQFPNVSFAQEAEDSNELKVMSYNSLSWRYNARKRTTTKPQQTDFILKQKPDILCMQETLVTSVKRSSKFHGYNIITSKDKYGTLILTKLSVLNKKEIAFEGSQINEVLYADLQTKTKDTIRVYNCHLESFKIKPNDYSIIDSLNLDQEKKQLKEVKTLASKMKEAYIIRAEQANIVKKSMKECPYPIITCGDFNDTPSSYAYNTVRGDLCDAFEEQGLWIQPTYHGKLPPFRIDYILFSDYFECTSFERFKVDYSDHYPVVATFSISK